MAPPCVSKRRPAGVLQSRARVLCTDFMGKNSTEPTSDVMEVRDCSGLGYALVVLLTIHYVWLRYITISRQTATEVELASVAPVGVVSTLLRSGWRSLQNVFAWSITHEHLLAAPAMHVMCGWWPKLRSWQLKLHWCNGGVG